MTAPAAVRHRDREDGLPGRRQALPVVLDIVRYRYPGDIEEWLYIGGEGQLGLDISVESARRLMEMMSGPVA